MTSTLRLTLGSILVILLIFGAGVALAANEVLYLLGDGFPQASMATSGLGTSLGDLDSDGDPGRTIERGGSGASEVDPDQYQQWVFDASGSTFGVTNLTLWVAAEDFDKARVDVTAYLLRCSPGCSTIATDTKSAQNASSWKKLTLSLSNSTSTFGPNEALVVKLIVPGSSDADAWLAYGITTYDASLTLTGYVPAPPPPPSTSSTTTTTATTTTTTTTTVPGPPNPPPTGPPPTGPPTTRPARPSTTTTLAATTPTTQVQASTTTTANDEDEGATGGTGSGSPPADPGGAGDGGAEPNAISEVLEQFDEAGAALGPQQGLMVAFATTSETIDLYWQVAVALGLLMTVLALTLFRGSDDFDYKARASARLRRFAANPFE